MGLRKKFIQFFKTFDLFSQPVTFRYNDQPEYETFTGGFCSIIMMAVFIAIFTGTAINTFNKVHVSSKIVEFEDVDPTYYEVGTSKFMFAVGINGLDLNEGDRWFDVYMQFRSYNSEARNKTYIQMVPCSRTQWTTVDESYGPIYDRLGFEKWLCPPEGMKIELQGKYTSEEFKFYKFAVKECDPSLVPSRPCVASSVISDYLDAEESFNFNFYFVNQIINGESHSYLNYYLEDMNYFPFSTTSGVNANIYMATYTISTDESIYPFDDIQNDTGGIVTQLAQIHNYDVKHDEYMKFYLRKSSQDILVERSFRKADDTLSYIGGLFSAILAVLVIMSLFTEFSYELEIAKHLYHYRKDEPLDSEGFNFFVYLGYIVYLLFSKLGADLAWEKMRKYHHSLEEVRKQMDIRIIMKKILYSEKLAEVVLDEHQRKLLHLQEPMTLEEAEFIRRDHRFYQNLKKYYFHEEKKQQQQCYQTDESIIEKNPNRITPLDELFEAEPEKEKEGVKQREVDKEQLDEDDLKEYEECEEMIVEMKAYIKKLEAEAESGNETSRKILEKFDCKLKKRFEEKAPKQRRLNSLISDKL